MADHIEPGGKTVWKGWLSKLFNCHRYSGIILNVESIAHPGKYDISISIIFLLTFLPVRKVFILIVDLLIFILPMKFLNIKISPANFNILQGPSLLFFSFKCLKGEKAQNTDKNLKKKFLALVIQCRISQLSHFIKNMLLSLILSAFLMDIYCIILDMVHINDKYIHLFRQIWVEKIPDISLGFSYPYNFLKSLHQSNCISLEKVK